MIKTCSTEEFAHRNIESLILSFFQNYPDIIQYYMELVYAIGSNEFLRNQIRMELFQFNEFLISGQNIGTEEDIISKVRQNCNQNRRNWKTRSRLIYTKRREQSEKNGKLLSEILITSLY